MCYLVRKIHDTTNSANNFFSGRESRPTTQSTLASTLATGTLPLRKDVSLQTILSSRNEVDEWRRNDLPTDEHALQNVLILRSCGDDRSRAWPLLIDPHNQAELWIRALHEGESSSSSSSLSSSTTTATTTSFLCQYCLTPCSLMSYFFVFISCR